MKSVGNQNSMQKSADARKQQLDKIAQQNKEQQVKNRENQQADREKSALARKKESQHNMKTNEDSLPIVSKAGPRTGLTRPGLAIVSLKDKIKNSLKKEEVEIDEAKGYKSQKELARREASYKKFNSPSALAAKQKRIEAHMAAQKTNNTAYKEKSVKEEIELDEAKRGRPPKNKTESDPGSDNIIMQLRKVITLRGQVPVTFIDGRKTAVSPATAHRLLAHYDNLRTTGEKHSFAARIHKSAESMRDVIAGKKEIVKPKISLGGTYRGK
jgi:hypothetical protein